MIVRARKDQGPIKIRDPTNRDPVLRGIVELVFSRLSDPRYRIICTSKIKQ